MADVTPKRTFIIVDRSGNELARETVEVGYWGGFSLGWAFSIVVELENGKRELTGHNIVNQDGMLSYGVDQNALTADEIKILTHKPGEAHAELIKQLQNETGLKSKPVKVKKAKPPTF